MSLHFLPEEEQVKVRSGGAPQEMSLSDRHVSPTLLDAIQTSGHQLATHHQSESIVVNGRPTTRAALHEYLIAGETARRTATDNGATRDIWHRDLVGNNQPGSSARSVYRSFLPTGASVDPDRAVVSGPTAPGHAERYPSTNVPYEKFGTEAILRHANQMRADFPATPGSPVVHQGTWLTEEKGGAAANVEGLAPKPAGSYVAVDASQEFTDPNEARDAMHARGETALFHPHSFDPSQDKWGEVRADPDPATGQKWTKGVHDPMGITDEDAGAKFRTRLTRPYTP